MAHILTDYGEEYLFKTDLSGVASLTFGLYNDGTDGIAETDDIEQITTEPDGTDYSSNSAAIRTAQINGDFGFDNDVEETFQVGDATTNVDSYYWSVSFTSELDADGAVEHLIVTGALSQTYDLSSVDTLNISANTAGLTVS